MTKPPPIPTSDPSVPASVPIAKAAGAPPRGGGGGGGGGGEGGEGAPAPDSAGTARASSPDRQRLVPRMGREGGERRARRSGSRRMAIMVGAAWEALIAGKWQTLARR